MLRVTQSKSGAAAKSYFREGLQRADYYVRGEDVPGRWHGKAAELLGLGEGEEVAANDFGALAEGHGITQRMMTNRRPGWDFTFNAPKSVSLLYAATGDERLADAVCAAVTETMNELQDEMAVRVRKAGANTNRITSNALWAEFLHTTTRPVTDKATGISEPDPHLHVHAYLMNASFDVAENAWKAAEIGELLRDTNYFEAAFQSRLASRVKGMGYPIATHGRWWDVALDRELLQKFSRRRAEIVEKGQELGLTNDRQKEWLGVATRARTKDRRPMDVLRALWKGRLHPAERDLIDGLHDRATGNARATGISAKPRVEFELEKGLQNASALPRRRFAADVLRSSYGDVEPDHVWSALKHNRTVIEASYNGRGYVTTEQVMAEENAMIDKARAGMATRSPLVYGDITLRAPILNEGQKSAVRHVLTSRDKVMLIAGGAGTGKTTLSTEAVAQMEAEVRRLSENKNIITLAPSHGAKDVMREEGFQDAETVQRFLIDIDLQHRAKGGVLWVDEAGLMSVPDMNRLLDVAGEADARVVLVGDTQQHSGIARGDAMRLLIEQGRMKPAHVRDIVRQSGDYRGAVRAAAAGDTKTAWQRFEKMGAVREVDTTDKARHVAADYLAEVEVGRNALVVTPTNREKDAITAEIRKGLRASGKLEGPDHSVRQLRNLHMTTAEKKQPDTYHAGQVVRLHQNLPGLSKGTHLTITAHDAEGHVIACDAKGERHVLPLDRPEHFDVYREARMDVAAGDTIRLTANANNMNGHRLVNGARHKVTGFGHEGELVLENGAIIDSDWGHIDHGVCSTSYAAQGSTVDCVIASLGAESLPAMSDQQFYVTVSRARGTGANNIRIYSDDMEAAKQATTQRGERLAAVELDEMPKAEVGFEEWAREHASEHSEAAFKRRCAVYRDQYQREHGHAMSEPQLAAAAEQSAIEQGGVERAT